MCRRIQCLDWGLVLVVTVFLVGCTPPFSSSLPSGNGSPAVPTNPAMTFSPTQILPSQTLTSSKALRFISSTAANLREGPGEQYDVIGRFLRGTQVELLWQEGEWASVRVEGKTGFFYLSFLTPIQPTP
ncbi:MAG: SH3 domain-containing protein [Coprothermobacterota bacterium]|nr:SH3 domain-containing protein [Coprothermobacterota bacterium]